ncbi:hypothetical protein [uncultured Ilyobacter sp.]|uniref:hypothetical protein n=1 Tax=uncultured Ilyobacter sp. TaxID=544433 RepID=UPI0029F5C08C|nr:hypothetical protein [uncultured Ilyobacter sp.]
MYTRFSTIHDLKKTVQHIVTYPKYIEDYVLTELENFLVNDETASGIVERVNEYVDQENNVYRGVSKYGMETK